MSNTAVNGQAGKANNHWPYIAFVVAMVFHAFSAPWVKQSNFDPAVSTILRCGIGALALVPFAMREAKKLGPINKAGVIYSIIAGLFLGFDFMAFNYSIYYVGSGIASILLNLQIIILPTLAWIFDKERPPKGFGYLVVVMILGVTMTGGLFDPGAIGGEASSGEILGMSYNLFGTLMGTVSGLSYGFYLYFSRKSSTINHGQFIQPMVYSFFAQLVAPFLFIVLFSERGFDIKYGVLANNVLPAMGEVGDPITGMNWLWMILLALGGQALTWTFIQYGSMNVNPAIAAGLLLLSPVATVAVIAPLLFGEIPSLMQSLGVVVVLTAVAVQNGVHKSIIGLFKKGDGGASAG